MREHDFFREEGIKRSGGLPGAAIRRIIDSSLEEYDESTAYNLRDNLETILEKMGWSRKNVRSLSQVVSVFSPSNLVSPYPQIGRQVIYRLKEMVLLSEPQEDFITKVGSCFNEDYFSEALKPFKDNPQLKPEVIGRLSKIALNTFSEEVIQNISQTLAEWQDFPELAYKWLKQFTTLSDRYRKEEILSICRRSQTLYQATSHLREIYQSKPKYLKPIIFYLEEINVNWPYNSLLNKIINLIENLSDAPRLAKEITANLLLLSTKIKGIYNFNKVIEKITRYKDDPKEVLKKTEEIVNQLSSKSLYANKGKPQSHEENKSPN